jgi:hypothetical protein
MFLYIQIKKKKGGGKLKQKRCLDQSKLNRMVKMCVVHVYFRSDHGCASIKALPKFSHLQVLNLFLLFIL